MRQCILSVIYWAALLGVALCSCSRAVADRGFDGGDTLTTHARYLSITELRDGTVAVDILPEGDGGRKLGYLLVARDSTVSEDLAEQRTVIRVPVQRAGVWSSVYTAAMADIDALDALRAVADASYFAPGDTITALLKGGVITDAGTSASPDNERLAAAGIEVVLRSPVAGQPVGALPPHTAAIECVDYLEADPKARAEWILLLGELFGRRHEAKAFLDNTLARYDSIATLVASTDTKRPKILVETEYSGVWYVPAGESYMAKLYADAGADYPWADTEGTGSLALSLESVASRAMDADLWLVRSYGYEATPKNLLSLNSRYGAFKALKDGSIYGCDSSIKPVFDDAAFHPDRLLAEYAAIFHPEIMPGYKLRYFNNPNTVER